MFSMCFTTLLTPWFWGFILLLCMQQEARRKMDFISAPKGQYFKLICDIIMSRLTLNDDVDDDDNFVNVTI